MLPGHMALGQPILSHFLLLLPPSSMSSTLPCNGLLTATNPPRTFHVLILLQWRKTLGLWENLLYHGTQPDGCTTCTTEQVHSALIPLHSFSTIKFLCMSACDVSSSFLLPILLLIHSTLSRAQQPSRAQVCCCSRSFLTALIHIALF